MTRPPLSDRARQLHDEITLVLKAYRRDNGCDAKLMRRAQQLVDELRRLR